MNPRARMMLQQRAQLPPGVQPGMQESSGGLPQSSPLLAQQLRGPMPQQPQNQPPTSQPQLPQQPQQPQPAAQQQPQNEQNNDELEGLDTAGELGDLGMGEEDILGMSENFDIDSFADALDDLEKMPETEKDTGSSESPATSTSGPNSFPGQTPTSTNVTAPTQGANVRAPPPPPYPGPQGQAPTTKVN